MWINANETLYLLYSPILSTHYGASNWLDTSTDPNPVYHHFHTKKANKLHTEEMTNRKRISEIDY